MVGKAGPNCETSFVYSLSDASEYSSGSKGRLTFDGNLVHRYRLSCQSLYIASTRKGLFCSRLFVRRSSSQTSHFTELHSWLVPHG